MSLFDPPMVGDVLEAKYYCYQGDQLGINVRHWKVTERTGNGVDLETIASKLSQDAAPTYKNLLNNTASYLGVGLTNRYPSPSSPQIISNTGFGAGLGGTTALPQQVTGVLTLRTAQGGRKGRGRSYIPFPSTLNNGTDDKPVAGYASVMESLGSLFTTNVLVTAGTDSTSLQPVLFHTNPMGSTSVLVGYTAQRRWGTQRRRGNYGKANPKPAGL